MAHPRPAAITVLGWSGLLFGLACVLWLILGRQPELTDLLAAAFGDRATAERLARQRLISVGAILAVVVPLLLEWALTLMLIGAAVGLLNLRWWARWTGLFYCGCIIPLEGVSALLHVFCLTPSDQPVKLVPIVASGLVTLFAIAFWGGLSLPETVAVWKDPLDESSPAKAP